MIREIGSKLSLNGEDVAQIVIGASTLAIPVSFSEEAWIAAVKLPVPNLILVFSLSICFLILYAHQSLFQASVRTRRFIFVFRIFIRIFSHHLRRCDCTVGP